MTRRATTWMAMGVLAAVAIGGLIGRLSAKECPVDPRREKLDDYCGMVNAAMRIDVRELGMPQYQEEAANRFARQIPPHSTPHHSYQEIELCSDMMPNLDRNDMCRFRHDYKCLEELARSAFESTKR